MEFEPIINNQPLIMDQRIFSEEPMGIKNNIMTISIDDRLSYNSDKNMFFVNFEGLNVETGSDIENIKKSVEKKLKTIDRKVFTIVNYDNFVIKPEIVDEYTDMINEIVKKYYSGVTRYTTSAFLRMKLGEALLKRNAAPHIYESSEEAKKALSAT
jgi:propionate CoA-transferase